MHRMISGQKCIIYGLRTDGELNGTRCEVIENLCNAGGRGRISCRVL
eukprot:SAG11_NODE_38483_length_252_cov_0.673203_1_plen_46_part_10